MSNEYVASETCRNEMHHALSCLHKPVLLLLVGTSDSVERDSRWCVCVSVRVCVRVCM